MTTSNLAETARAWADIDLAAVVANALTVERAAGTRLLPMIKADAYGLGAVPVARALEEVQPWGYGVATIPEASALREAGIDRPLIAFTPLLPSQIEACLELHLRPVIGDLDALEAWTSRTARPFHLEIDTGMARSGLRWDDRAALARATELLGGASGWEGVFTHFHSPDDAPDTMRAQWERFQDVVAAFPSRPPLVHAAASAAAVKERRFAADMVRPGIFLYGGGAGGQTPETVVRLHARVVSVRTIPAGESVSYGARWVAESETRIATIGIGYADGIMRTLSNRGRVHLGGRECRIVGSVTMDLTMVLLEGDAMPGDVATVLGEEIPLDEQAALAGTISYELLTSIGPRVVRRYGIQP